MLLREAVQEDIRESDSTCIALLDAKAAFDTVDHNLLDRKLFLAGVQGKTWVAIRDLSKDACTQVKWRSDTSDSFSIQQGVRQGGILSTELYKIFVNDLLNCIETSQLGS